MRLRLLGLLAVVALAFGLTPLVAEAQQPGKVARVGFLASVTPATAAPVLEPFRQGLRRAGWIEGQNIVIEYRFDPKNERLPDRAAELLRQNVDVMVTWGTPAGLAARRATTIVPIVSLSGDPVGTGLVESLARPGGNITGIAAIHRDVIGKRMELLKEVLPRLSRVSVIWNPTNSANGANWRETLAVATTLGVKPRGFEVRSREELDGALAAITREQKDALFVVHDFIPFDQRTHIAQLALKNRIPTSFSLREYVDAGGLMSYGVSFPDLWRRLGGIVDKVLKGAKAADLPVEQPTKFELVINMKTAKALGLAIPHSLLLRADQVISD